MNSSAKHAAPPISPARVQSSAKKNKKQQSSGVVRQSTLFQSFNIVKIDEVSAMEASHTRFNCINNIFEELDGQPIMFNFEKKEEATCLEKEVDDIILKMSDPTVEESTLLEMGVLAESKKKEYDLLNNSLKKMTIAVADIRKARENAELGLKFNKKTRIL
jgi:hypothetical protein